MFLELYHGGIPEGLNRRGHGTFTEDAPVPGTGEPSTEALTVYAVARTQAVMSDLLLFGGSSRLGKRPVGEER